MEKTEWFRNETWDADIEADLYARLSRAREKARSQYPLIEALHLMKCRPEVTLKLMEECLSLGQEDTVVNAAFNIQAGLIFGDIEAALVSLEAALGAERRRSKVLGQSYLGCACTIAERLIVRLCERATDVLDTPANRMALPVQQYRAAGARALILRELA